jgi:antitoxin MazE
MHQLDRSALAMDLRRLQATMPLTPSVMEECRAAERW